MLFGSPLLGKTEFLKGIRAPYTVYVDCRKIEIALLDFDDATLIEKLIASVCRGMLQPERYTVIFD